MIKQLNFKKTVSALTEEKETQYSPLTGRIMSAILHFPPGCNSLVEILIRHKTEQILPEPPGGIALDDATPTFNLNHPVVKDEPIEVVWRNHDGLNSHTCPVIILVEGE